MSICYAMIIVILVVVFVVMTFLGVSCFIPLTFIINGDKPMLIFVGVIILIIPFVMVIFGCILLKDEVVSYITKKNTHIIPIGSNNINRSNQTRAIIIDH